MDIHIEDSEIAAIRDSYTKSAGYSDQISDNVGGWIPNPQTRDQFIEARLYAVVKNELVLTTKRELIRQATDAIQSPIITVPDPKAAATPAPVDPAVSADPV